MISVRTHTGWIVGTVAAMAVLGVGAQSPAWESDEKLPVAKEDSVLVASTSFQKVMIPPRTSRGYVASPVAHRVSAQARGALHKVDTVRSSRKSAPSHAQEAPLTLEELRQLERRLDSASLSYWNTQLNPTH